MKRNIFFSLFISRIQYYKNCILFNLYYLFMIFLHIFFLILLFRGLSIIIIGFYRIIIIFYMILRDFLFYLYYFEAWALRLLDFYIIIYGILI